MPCATMKHKIKCDLVVNESVGINWNKSDKQKTLHLLPLRHGFESQVLCRKVKEMLLLQHNRQPSILEAEHLIHVSHSV